MNQNGYDNMDIDSAVSDLIDVMISERFAVFMVSSEDNLHEFVMYHNMCAENVMNFLMFRLMAMVAEICKNVETDSKITYNAVMRHVLDKIGTSFRKLKEQIEFDSLKGLDVKDFMETILCPIFFPKKEVE